MKKHPGMDFPARVWIWRVREAERVGEGGGGKNIAKKSLTWVFRNQGGGGGGGMLRTSLERLNGARPPRS